MVASLCAGGGWYRCLITLVLLLVLSDVFFIRTGNGNNGTYLGDGVSGGLSLGAQLNRGSVPTAYLQPLLLLASAWPSITILQRSRRRVLLRERALRMFSLLDYGWNLVGWTVTGVTAARDAIAPNGRPEATTLTQTLTTAIHATRPAGGIGQR